MVLNPQVLLYKEYIFSLNLEQFEISKKHFCSLEELMVVKSDSLTEKFRQFI